VFERWLRLPLNEVAGTVNFTAEIACFPEPCRQNRKRILKADQCGILAQNFLLCGKVRREIFREGLFIARMGGAVK
jgi:hypothetical protein